MANTGRTGATRGDRVALAVLAGIAAALGVLALGTGVYQTLMVAVGDETPLRLLTDAELPHDVDADPGVVAAVFDSASVTASGLSDGTRALLAIGTGLGALTAVVVCAAIAYLLATLSRGRPFARPLFGLALAAGATLTLGSLLSDAIHGFGQMNAATELNPGADDVFVVGFEFDPTLWLVGFAIMALAYVFRAGRGLERDTAGLV